MADKRLNVELGFTANVSQAQAQLNTLKTTLKSIANTGATNLPLNTSLQKAVDSAKTLQTHLNKAFNQSTGNIDLGRLQNSLSASGDSLTKLSKNLLNAGTTGEKSFVALQNSITNANVKLTQSQSLMESFAISLKNAAKWQLSSSILHGFMGSLQTAYGYAQDLNESLNNIRIVTGYGADKMASFALEANRAAQALSTTTTKYTDASLIFYQQGLSDKEVLARTETAIKLANVSRQSTQEVSDQMTAIWNNFYDGSKSLEYYADAITALGAKTASSSEEIATGLSKFAAIGDTVGLSYEYATASLATITAQTRQSADVVGNALKTLFARIQGLKMDEKQEDGTDFNKYSKALLNVGVSVKDANGQLKEMDQILDELGARWNSLSKNQQMATAQTVAGVRQYTQLIALMNNWDIMQENVAIAKNSAGTLQEQANIYAESWEASRDRVRAALESIYSSLVDDKFFISMNNNLAKIINGVDNVVKSLGGFKGALLLIANIFLTQFQGEVISGLQNLGVKFQQVGINISNIGKNVDESAGKWAKFKGIVSDTFSVFDTSKLLMADLKNSLTAALEGIPTDSFRGYVEGLQQINSKKEEILRINSLLNDSEKSILETHLQELTQLNEEIRLARQKTEEAENYFATLQMTSLDKDYSSGNMKRNQSEFLLDQQNQLTDPIKEYVRNLAEAANIQVTLTDNTKIQCDSEANLQILRDQGLASYKGMLILQGQSNDILREAASIANNMLLEQNRGINQDEQKNKLLEETKSKLYEIISAQEIQGNLTSTQTQDIRNKIEGLKGEKAQYEELLSYIRNMGHQYTENSVKLKYDAKILEQVNSLATQELINWKNITEQQQSSKNALEQISKIMDSVQSRSAGMAGMFTSMITGASSLAMSINTVRNSWQQLNREEASFVDKLVSGTMMLTAAVRGLSTVFSGATTLIDLFVTASGRAAAASEIATLQAAKEKLLREGLTAITKDSIAIKALEALTTKKYTKEQLIENVARDAGITKTEAQIVVEKLFAKFTGQNATAITKQRVQQELNNIAKDRSIIKTNEETIVTRINTEEKKKNAAAQALQNLKMLAAIAIIAALVAGIWLAVKAYNADAEAAEKAAKTSEKLNKAAEETTERLNKIKTAVSGYEEAVTALQNCTKGTEEWNTALGEVQDKTAQLLKDFPELLAMGDILDENGVIKAEALDAVTQNLQTAADNADAAALWGQVESYRARSKSDITDLSRSSGYYTNRDQADTDVQTIARNMDKIKAAGSTAEAVLKTIEINVDKATDAQKVFADSLLKTANSYIQAATAADNASKILINSWADDKGINLKTGQAELMAAQQTQEYDKFAEALKNANISNSSINNKDYSSVGEIFKGTQFEGMSITQAFNQARGTNYELARNGVRGTDNNRSYAFLENGETKEYKFEEMQATIAAAAALEKLTESAATASQTLGKIDQNASSADVAQGLKSWIATGDFADMTQTDFTALKGDVGNPANISDVVHYMQDTFDMNAEELATNFGADFAEKFQKAMIDYETSLNTLMDSWTEGVYNTTKQYLENLGIDSDSGPFAELTKRQKTKFAQAYRSIFEQGGKEGLEAVNAIIKAAQQQGKDFSKVADLITSTDWKNWDSITNLNDKLSELGITIDDQLINEILRANHVSKNFSLEEVNNQFAKVQSIAQDLKIGDIISQDDFDEIEKMGVDIDHFFTQMSDGTYKLTEDANTFYDTILSKHRDDLLEGMRSDLFNAAQMQENYNTAKNNVFQTETPETIGRSALESDGDYDLTLLNKQLTLIKEFNTATEDQIAHWESLKYHGGLTVDIINQVADAAGQAALQFNGLSTQISTQTNAVITAQEAYLSSARTLEEFDMLVGNLEATFGEGFVAQEAYSKALISLSSQYDNCADEIEKYSDALKTGNKETIDSAESALRLATTIGELSERYDLVARDVETQAKLLQREFNSLSKTMKLTELQAANIAVGNQRMVRGVETLNSNFKAWNKTLTTAKKTSAEYASTLNDVYDALADLVGCASAAEIPLDFLDATTAEGAEHMQWLAEASTGSSTAISLLGTELAAASIQGMQLNETLVQSAINTEGLSTIWKTTNGNISAEFENYKKIVIDGINNLHEQIRQGNVQAGQDVSEFLNTTQISWNDAMNALAVGTGQTVSDINRTLNMVGVTMQVTAETVDAPVEVPTYSVRYKKSEKPLVINGPNGPEEWDGYDFFVQSTGTETVPGKVTVGQVKAEGNASVPDRPRVLYTGTSGSGSKNPTGAGAVFSSPTVPSSSSGSSSRPSSSSKTPKSKAEKTETAKTPKEPTVTTNEADPAEAKKEFTRYDEAVGRYHRIEDALDNLARAAEKAANATEKLYGKDKLDSLTKENKLLQNNIWLLEQKKKQAQIYLDFDKNNLQQQWGVLNQLTGGKFNTGIKFSTSNDPTDPNSTNGDILNYNEIQADLLALLNERQNYYNNPNNFPVVSAGTETEYDDEGNPTSITHNQAGGSEAQEAWKEQNIDPLVEAIDLFNEYVAQYDETKEKIQDTNQEIEEKKDEIRAKNAEKIKLHFEYQVEVNDRDRAILDWLASRVSDNVYTKIEFITTQMGSPLSDFNLGEGSAGSTNGKNVFGDNQYVKDIKSNIAAAEANIKLLDENLKSDKITQADWVEGMRNATDSIMENVDALREYNTMMRTLYAETIPQMAEEIDRYTDSMEYCTSVLQHYENVAGLLTGFIDYEWEATLYDGMIQTTLSQLEAASGEYELWKQQVDILAEQVIQAQNKVDAARASGNANMIAAAEENLKYEKQNYDEAVNACKEAYDKKLSLAANYIETLKKQYTSQLKDIFSKAEREAFNGYTIDQIKTNMERLKTIQEDYLNGQEKAYEINKMLRKMNQDMSKTQNKQAQDQIRAFQQETLALGKREKLSKYELEIQQKRYDLLLAQQALMDAQNAKTHVTLRRDEEGNYGYIYTADQEQIDQANQNYEDKYYALFETVLSGYEDFYEKMVNNEIEYWTEIEAINMRYINGEYQSYEDYQKDLEECEKYYSQRRLNLQELTNVGALALQNSLNIKVDAATGKFVEDELKKYAGLKVGVLDEHKQMKDRLVIFYSHELSDEVLDAIQDLTGATEAELRKFANLVGGNFEGLKTVIINAVSGIYGELDGSIISLNKKLTNLKLTDALQPALDQVGLLGDAWVNSGMGTLQNLLLGSQPGGTDGLATLLSGFATASSNAQKPISDCINAFTKAMQDAKKESIGDTLQTFADKVQAVADAAKDLNTQLNDPNGVYKKFSDILDKIGLLTQAWQANALAIQSVITNASVAVKTAETKVNNTIGVTAGGSSQPVVTETPTAVAPSVGGIYDTTVTSTMTNPTNGQAGNWVCAALAMSHVSNQQPVNTGGGGGGTDTTPSDEATTEWSCNKTETISVVGAKIYNSSDGMTWNRKTGGWIEANKARDENGNYLYKDSRTGYCSAIQYSTPAFQTGKVQRAYWNTEAPIHISGIESGGGGGFFTVDDLITANPGFDIVKFLESFDTGGYTGIWNDTGRLAMLHQKELVLNKDDTSNLLSAVDILRNIVSQLDLQTMSAKLGLLSLTAASFTSPIGNETIDQNVKIEASFPNVSDRNEIEEAFSDLINTASQYAHRKI